MKNFTMFVLPLAATFVMGCASTPTSSTAASSAIAAGAGCAQLNDDKTLAKIYEPGAIYAAKPVQEKIFRARAIQPTVTVGASLYVRAEPAMNAAYMHRVLACHAASDSSAHPNDPLHPSNGSIARLDVREAKSGFVIDVVADKPSVGEEIWRRAESISQSGGSVDVQQVGSNLAANAAL